MAQWHGSVYCAMLYRELFVRM